MGQTTTGHIQRMQVTRFRQVSVSPGTGSQDSQGIHVSGQTLPARDLRGMGTTGAGRYVFLWILYGGLRREEGQMLHTGTGSLQ
uniref:Uncharacterized protein n=1 Tax=Faecalibaculum rodentium TaxID=1702221 RepID=A0A140DWF7_9FIRM|nr:hypothetical protein AALO17_18500 [Faecalibaculum rodentium]